VLDVLTVRRLGRERERVGRVSSVTVVTIKISYTMYITTGNTPYPNNA